MAADLTIARPYAKAVFDLAVKNTNLDEWTKLLTVSSEVIKQPDIDDLLYATVNNSTIIKIITNVIKDVDAKEAPEMFTNFLEVLAEKHRLGYLPAILELYTQYREKTDLPTPVEIISARKLDKASLEKIKLGVEKKIGKSATLKVTIDESIIAGIIIKTDDFIIDGSTRYQLEQLTHSIVGL